MKSYRCLSSVICMMLNVNLENLATSGSGNDALGGDAILSTNDTYITINNNTHVYGDIDAGAENMQYNAFEISIADNVPDQHVAQFDLTITGTDAGGNSYTWNSSFNIILNAPFFGIGDVFVTNDDNGNGYIAPGETGDNNFTITNTGHADTVYNGTLSINSNPNNYLTLGTTTISGINLAAGASQDLVFTGASVDASAVLGTEIELVLDVTAGNNQQYSEQSQQNIFTGAIPVYTINNGSTVTACTGIFYDSGSDIGNYSNNEDYTITFLPGNNADFVIVDFISFDVESDYDMLHVYDGPDVNSSEIPGSPFSGTNSPGTLSSANGLTFRFVSDSSINDSGWEANVSCYTPTTVPNCAANPVPDDNATNVYITTAELTWDNQIGVTSYDVYFGTDSNPFNITPVTTNVNRFSTNLQPNTTYYWAVVPENSVGQASGCQVWSFTTGGNVYNMTDGATITTCSGVFFDDGGHNNLYSNNLDQTMTFLPGNPNNTYLSFYFTTFDVEESAGNQFDYLKVYDGTDSTAPLIGKFSGIDGTVPADLQPVVATNTEGALTFVFHSDYSVRKEGWEANIDCISLSVDEYNNVIGIYPNPNNGSFTIKLKDINKAFVKVYSTTGKLVYSKLMNTTIMNIDLSAYAKGVYFVRLLSGDNAYTKKLILK